MNRQCKHGFFGSPRRQREIGSPANRKNPANRLSETAAKPMKPLGSPVRRPITASVANGSARRFANPYKGWRAANRSMPGKLNPWNNQMSAGNRR